MSDGKFNHKRGAPGGSQGHNPINTVLPQEYICLVGGPTNTFNAWWTNVWHKVKDESFWAAMPAPTTRGEIDYYIAKKPAPMDPAKEKDPKEWKPHGWSGTAMGELMGRGWTTRDVDVLQPHTHDLYWANFVDAAIRLYRNKDPFPAPRQRPAPRRGDIVTFFIYAPAYVERQRVDWNASPYNRAHLSKVGVHGNPLYDPRASRWPPSKLPLPAGGGKPAFQTTQDKILAEKRKAMDEAVRRQEKHKPISEEDVNHYILMRTTSENKGVGYTPGTVIIKRPPNNYAYFDYLEEIVSVAVPNSDVMCKVLFFSHPRQVLDYMQKGTWIGEPIVRNIDEYQVEEYWRERDARQAELDKKQKALEVGYDVDSGSRYALDNFQYSPPKPVARDIHGRPLKWKLYWNKMWDPVPNVDRNRIKIVRFDYFGHASSDVLMLQWGWTNEKGHIPDLDKSSGGEELAIYATDLGMYLRGQQLAKDAQAMLWGCNLGNEFAPKAAPLFGGGVIASDTYTDFEKIIHNDTNMPEPVDGEPWKVYKTTPAKKAPARVR